MKFKNNIINISLFLVLITSQAVGLDSAAHTPATTIEREIGQQQLSTTIQKAVGLRRLTEMDRLSKERGSHEENRLAHEINLHAVDYTTSNSHESSIKSFIERNFGVTSNNLYCVDPERITTREFVFIDKENRVVIKVYPQIPEHYFKIVHELSGYKAFLDLRLKSIDLVNFLSLGKYTLQGIDYIILGMSYSDGQEIRKYIDKIFDTQDPELRRKSIELTKEILQKLGGAVGDIHATGALSIAIPEGYIETVKLQYENDINITLNQYEERGGQYRAELETYFEKLLASYNFQTTIFSLYHGDAHLGNFLYDTDSDRITVIDSVKAHLTVDPTGLPISDKFVHDSIKIDESIAKQILSHEYNESLIHELIGAFHQGYDEKAASLLNPITFELDKSLQMLKRLASALMQEQDPVKQEYRQRSFEYYEKILIENSTKNF